MKLRFDENLSPRLVWGLADLFPDSSHVNDRELGAAVDQEIWQYAADHDFVIVSKDLDFNDRSLLLGSPPKVIWLRIGNCSTGDIEHLLRTYSRQILAFESKQNETHLILP